MGTYQATINIAGFRQGETKECPETPRIAALVREGFLISKAPALLEPIDGDEVEEATPEGGDEEPAEAGKAERQSKAHQGRAGGH